MAFRQYGHFGIPKITIHGHPWKPYLLLFKNNATTFLASSICLSLFWNDVTKIPKTKPSNRYRYLYTPLSTVFVHSVSGMVSVLIVVVESVTLGAPTFVNGETVR